MAPARPQVMEATPESDARQAMPCIQPGGGFFFDLEAGWGRLRRLWLRRVRPGYVERMAALRQGECAACPHDIVDARDLKLVRSACGYWFRAEDDAFRWRGRLRLARAGLAEVVVVSLASVAAIAPLVAAGLAFGHPALLAAAAVVAFFWFELVWFFRDPERSVTSDASALVSPADGRVTHLEEVDAPDFPGGRAFRISLWLSPLDVHLNRLPRSGRVLGLRYFPGRFVNARREDAAKINEQLWLDMVEPNGRRLRVKQISGALARRLVCWLKPGEQVRIGERYGMIKYGSRCDILLPASEPREVCVKIGDKVNAGSTVLLRFQDAHGQTPRSRG